MAAEAEADQPEATEVEDEEVEAARTRPGFSKLIDGLAGLTSFYGHGFKVEPVIPAEPSIEEPRVDLVADEPAVEQPEEEPEIEEPALEEPTVEQATVEVAAVEEDAIEEPPVEEQLLEDQSQNPKASEGPLQTKLAEVRTRADEARKAKLQANVALYEGLGAAYDFALDAEDSPEEYLRLVEAQGLKIQLRSPMTPVVKLAFDGLCDDSTIGQLEAVLAWALAQDLPRGSLAGRIEEAGGIGKILSGESAAA